MVSSLATYYMSLQNFPIPDQEPQTTFHLLTAPKQAQAHVCQWERPSGSAHFGDDTFWKYGKDVIAARHRLQFHRNCLLELSCKNGSNMVLSLKFMEIMRRQSFYSSWKEQRNEEFIVGTQSAPTSSLHLAAQ